MKTNDIFEPQPIDDNHDSEAELDELKQARGTATEPEETTDSPTEIHEPSKSLVKAFTLVSGIGVGLLCERLGKQGIEAEYIENLGAAMAGVWVEYFPNIDAPDSPWGRFIQASGMVLFAVAMADNKPIKVEEDGSATHSVDRAEWIRQNPPVEVVT